MQDQMEKRRKNRIILSCRYSDTRFRRKKLEVHTKVHREGMILKHFRFKRKQNEKLS